MNNKDAIKAYAEKYQAMYEESLAKLKKKRANAKIQYNNLINKIDEDLKEYKLKLEELKEAMKSGAEEKIAAIKSQSEDLWDNFTDNWNELLNKEKKEGDNELLNKEKKEGDSDDK